MMLTCWNNEPNEPSKHFLISQSVDPFIYHHVKKKKKESMSIFLCLFFVICVLVTHARADFCGGNCPSGDCPSCPCGTTVNKIDIAAWCAKHTWNRSHCECIMNAESKGNSNSVNYNSDGTYDVGLWQINKYNWNACSG